MTPMMEQYRSIKKTLSSDTVLFFRLGDFYEMFFEDAVRASEILRITLTGRDGGGAGRVPMCGIPYHAFSQYVPILLDHNLKVAICEQIGDPQPAKGLVERKITRIITPATFLDEEATRSSRPEIIVAIACDRGGTLLAAEEVPRHRSAAAAVAALDPATGDFSVRETEWDRLPNELALLQPREVVLPAALARDPLLMPLIKESLRAALTVYDEWVFEPAEGVRLLKETFSLGSDRAVPLHDRPLAAGACGAVLYYLKDHLHAALDHLRPPAPAESRDGMALDRQTLRSLELVSGLNGEKKAATLLAVIDQTLTPMGGRTLYRWLIRPLLDLEQIRQRQEGTAELAENPTRVQSLRLLCKGIRDIERTLSRLNCGVANARDLLNLKLFLERVPEIQRVLEPCRGRLLQELRRVLNALPELQELIALSVTDAPPLGLREGGMIREGHSAELDNLRRLASQGKSWLVEFERRESERTGIRSLRVRYNQVFGYSIEVSKPNLALVPPEYVRRQTLANAERFVVPELQQWDERITGAQDRIRQMEYELFQQLRGRVLERLSPLQESARAAGVLDALSSLAVTALEKRWIRPELSDSLELSIEGGRHPVVEAMLPSGQFVENDTVLDGADQQLIVLTGPNMAGKSTALRQTAHIVLLAQIGSFVPARSARIGIVDRIFTRIGARDDLAQGESTFMVEMVEMAQILQAATRRSLLILDEVGRGTSTFDGVSLAWALCEHLAQGAVRPRTLFATHYHELVQLEGRLPGVKNYTVSVRETPEGILFLRKIVRGGSDRSYGIHVAQLAGIPRAVTERAAEILKVLEAENADATKILEGPAQPVVPQLPLHSGLLRELAGLKLDSLTPIDALNKLAELKRKLEEKA